MKDTERQPRLNFEADPGIIIKKSSAQMEVEASGGSWCNACSEEYGQGDCRSCENYAAKLKRTQNKNQVN